MMTEEQAKSLLLKQENVYTRDPQLREPAFAYCEGYKAFLNAAKTEREAVEWAVREAEANGFVPYDPTGKLQAGRPRVSGQPRQERDAGRHRHGRARSRLFHRRFAH